MKLLKFGCIGLAILFASLIVWAALTGSFFSEGIQIFAMPWGKVMLADLYIGFGVFSLLIVALEKSHLKKALWIGSLMVLGNGVALIFLFINHNRIVSLFQKGRS